MDLGIYSGERASVRAGGKKERKNIVVKKIEEKKRLIFFGLHRKPIKPLYGTCSVYVGHRLHLRVAKAPHFGHLFERALEARAGK